jgi:hypothetical protein
MDFLAADEFLDHLEMHPNGSFVLVKRDIPPPPTQMPSEPLEVEEPLTSSPILPEMLGNQIKVRAEVIRRLSNSSCRSNFRLNQSVTTTKMNFKITKSASRSQARPTARITTARSSKQKPIQISSL